MDVSVVIVTYNSRGVIGPCLDALRAQKLTSSTEVIVVDNASSDGTGDFIRQNYPWVRLLPGETNLGFSRGVNAGIACAGGRYYLILNPDTVVKDDAIERLVRFMDATPDAGIAGPRLVFEDGTLQYSCRRFYNWRVLLLRRTFLGRLFPDSDAVGKHLMRDFDHQSTRDVDWLLGACMMVRRDAVDSVGLMDERFFLYFEDVDWCYRMHQKGWKVYYHPEAEVVHAYARGSAQRVLNRSFVAHLASLIRYYEKWNFVLYFLKRYREFIKVLLFLSVDLVAFNLAFLSAYYLRLGLGDVFTNPIFPITAYKWFVIFQNLILVFTYFSIGLYRIRRDTKTVDELFDIGRAVVVACVLLMASTYLGQIRTYSRLVVAFIIPFAVAYDWWVRYAVRRVHRLMLEQMIDLRRVCIVGADGPARALASEMASDARLGVEVVAMLPGLQSVEDGLTDALADQLAHLERVIDTQRVQEIIFLPDAVPQDLLADCVMMGRRRVVDVTVLTDHEGLVVHHARVADLMGRPAVVYRRDSRYALDRFAKRAMDILLSVIFSVVSLPVAMVYFLHSLMRSRKPFTLDERLGLGGKPVKLPIAGTGSSNGPSDIVNLPLFLFVLAGKLSMVGPYALPVRLGDRFDERERFRFDVRPGVTGYWRVGRDHDVTWGELLAQDANYTRNWSLGQDLKILAVTFPNLILGRKRTLTIRD